MLDFGWPELLLIAAVAILIAGPDDIPKIMYGLGKAARRLQYLRFALSQQFEDFMQDTDLKDLQKQASLQTEGDSLAEQEDDEALATESVENLEN